MTVIQMLAVAFHSLVCRSNHWLCWKLTPHICLYHFSITIIFSAHLLGNKGERQNKVILIIMCNIGDICYNDFEEILNKLNLFFIAMLN